MTTEEYRAYPAVNFSSLKHILKSPAAYKAHQDGEDDFEESDAMKVGTLAHAMILEGKNLLDMYAIKPAGMSFANKEGKAWRDAQTKPILKEEDANKIPKMAESIANNLHARHIIKQCQFRETPILANIKGVNCKCLLDSHGTDGVHWIICDIKTTDDVSPQAFARKVANMDYDFQQSLYTSALSIHEQIADERPFWFWIAVQNKSPFTSVVYTADEWIDSGDDKMMRALDLYKECTAKGEWPQPYGGINKLPKPAWA